MKVYRIIWILSSLVLTYALLTPQPSIAQRKIPHPVDSEWTGRFFIANTSEQKTLNEPIFSGGIGTTYNVTITVHSNSSSGVNFSTRKFGMWDGLSEFQVFPNESFTTSYISLK